MTEIDLTRADDGKALTVNPGDVVSISLPETPTSGFRWAVDSSDPDILEPLDSEWHESVDTGGLGSGGERRLRFKVRQPGTTQLKLKRWREWEGDRSVVERFDTNLKVGA